jgi:hypothetical protein
MLDPKIKKFEQLYKIYQTQSKNCSYSKKLKLLLLNAPCNGFGDLIFVKKLADYIRNAFKISVTIATTEPKNLLMLGEQKRYLKKLASIEHPAMSVRPCRVFHDLRMYDIEGHAQQSTENYDLYFIAPLSFDYDPKLSDVRPLVPHATKFNTFFFSEYNDTMKKDFDFHTGVGKGRSGILLTDPKSESDTKVAKLVNKKHDGPFALVYIAKIDSVISCVNGFFELISKKYNHHKHFQIIIPPFLYDDIAYGITLPKILAKYWSKVTLISKKDKMDFEGTGKSKLVIKANILPVKNTMMIGLIKHSVRDILLTGDQSITDALSCCSKTKNIFYQIAPWKADFGKEMAKEMPNKYLRSMRTSCGNLSAIKYKSSYGRFIKQHDFFKNEHDRIRSILCMITAYQDKQSEMHRFINIVNSSKTLAQVKKKLGIYDKKSRKSSRKRSRKASVKHL